MVKLKVTIVLHFEADPDWYPPEVRDPEDIAKFEQQALLDETAALEALLDGVSDITVEPVNESEAEQ